MEKFIEITKSMLASIAFVSVIALTLISINALNPVSKIIIKDGNSAAGVQDNNAQEGLIRFSSAGSKFTMDSKTIKFNLIPGQEKYEIGQITISNNSSQETFGKLSAAIESTLDNKLRIELIDEFNTILLTDFNKDFEWQRINVKANSSRTFTVRYILNQPVNYLSTVAIKIN